MDFLMKLAGCCRCDSTFVRQTYWKMLLATAQPPAYDFFGVHSETLLMMVVRHVLVPLPTQRQALELLVDRSSEMLEGLDPSDFTSQVSSRVCFCFLPFFLVPPVSFGLSISSIPAAQLLSQVLSLSNWEAVSDVKWGRYASHMLYSLLVDSTVSDPGPPHQEEQEGEECSAMEVEGAGATSSSSSADPLPRWMHPDLLPGLATANGPS